MNRILYVEMELESMYFITIAFRKHVRKNSQRKRNLSP